ncbi:MAG: S8 family serine peptidase [Candidatus Accumulibacter sp.]|jgi:outer membrane autotransporter protein|nr:S8 family serine peptidase [Accumulibacter sp.]
MSRRTHFLAAVALMALCGLSAPARAASADDFRTAEYLDSTGLESLHAAEAYALGFTGKGVTLAILDSNAWPAHPEFAAKNPFPVEYYTNPVTYTNWVHGVHTSGTIAATRDGYGMHGVAFDANLLSLVGVDGDAHQNFSPEPQATALKSIWNHPEISIISNSWAYSYLNLAQYQYRGGSWLYGSYMAWEIADVIAPLAHERDLLLVFGAGNDGMSSPAVPAALPSVLGGAQLILGTANPHNVDQGRRLARNIISVMAFDPSVPQTNSLTFIAPFSNLADGARNYSLLAPGVNIYSSVVPRAENGDSYYVQMSGTSMATPHVAGVAALASEAFPYMGGKQLADVLLSTADPITDLPPFVILIDYASISLGFRVFTADANLDSSALNGREDEIRKIYDTWLKDTTHPVDYAAFRSALANVLDSAALTAGYDPDEHGKRVITPEQYKGLFGMGIVNAYRAVQGPGLLDASRMWSEDKDSAHGGDFALYPVDTKGYDSFWSNDIGQVKVDAANTDLYNSALLGLDVGLRKQGAGVLYLTGNNSYSGPTVVESGGISLGQTGQADRTAKLAGDVYIGPDGLFTGNGFVAGSLESHGLLRPGLESGPSDLTVQGDVSSDGTLQVQLWPEAGRANKLVVGGDLDLSGATVDVVSMAGGGDLPTGRYAVIESDSLTGQPINAEDEAQQGATLLHKFRLDTQDKTLYFSYAGSAAAPQAQALSEGFLSSMALINRSADTLEAGLSQIVTAARSGMRQEGSGLTGFAITRGGRSRHDTGSHIDVSGFSLLTGATLARPLSGTNPGILTLGAFLEYGQGDYDSHNAFTNAAPVKGHGDTDHLGVGLLGHYEINAAGPRHSYLEASGRIGRAKSDFASPDLRDSQGQYARYDTESQYYGLHIGAGHVWKASEAATLELYGKYFWTRRKGDTVTLPTGDPVKFKAVDSHRLRLGARLSHPLTDKLSAYLGAAYEHEFAGKARATTYGHAIDAPELRGSTGIGEFGLSARPTSGSPIRFDLGVQGYTGRREGVTGSVQVRFEF